MMQLPIAGSLRKEFAGRSEAAIYRRFQRRHGLAPDGVARGNWIQTDPAKGWVALLRLYSPMPSFFDKSWQPTEIEPVN